MDITDDKLEWAIWIALECRLRVNEQQKRIGSAEFRNTMFSYHIRVGGIEQYVSTPELHSENTVSPKPLPPGQIWAIGPGEENEGNGLYMIEVTATPGSSIRLINIKAPSGLRESLRAAEQVINKQSNGLIGDHDPKSNEFAVQIRALSPVSGGIITGHTDPSCNLFCSVAQEPEGRGCHCW
jgi:Predicted ATP-dependent Lon-type protease